MTKARVGLPDTWMVFLIFFLFFILNLTANFSGPHDSMGYLNELQGSYNLFRTEHILYHGTVYILFHFLRLFLPHVPDYLLVETVDAAWGCLALTVVYRIFINRMRMTRPGAFLGTLIVAFSFGMWFYCSNIEVYMPPLFFLLLGLYVCMKDQLRPKDVVSLTAIHIMAVLYHQSNVLFTPIIVWKFWDSRRTIPFFPSLVRYAVASFIVVAGVYFVIGWWVEKHNSVADFVHWIRGYTTPDNDYWLPLGPGSFLKVAIGWGHAFFGGHFIFRIGFLEHFMNKTFYYHSLDDEAYLARNLSSSVAMVLLILTILIVLFILYLLFRIIRHWRTLYHRHRRLMVPLLLFLLCYSCFFLFWIPENLEFWIPQTGVLWIFLIGINAQLETPAQQRRSYLPYTIVFLFLFIVNYEGSIRWMKDIHNDSVFVKIEKVKDLATPKDVVILQDPWLQEDFLRQYTPSDIRRIPTEGPGIAALDQKVDSVFAAGGKVFLFTLSGSVNSSKNTTFIDSLIAASPGRVTDLHNELTPVMVITAR
jgi:hypothetical protein